jgi:PKD repeat protein
MKRIVLLVLAGATAALLLGAVGAQAVVVPAEPTWPIPANPTAGPPPIEAFPPAGDIPPLAEAIADPVRPAATCGDWHRQSSYGDRWPAGSTWWEYRCSDSYAEYHNTCPGPACDAFCPTCWWEIREWTDHFFWDGANAVFYGEAYSESVIYDSEDSYSSVYWWDAPTLSWYTLGPLYLTVSVQGTGSGEVRSSPGGIVCPYACQAGFDAGITVTLTATAAASSSFTGWSGPCSGTGTCQVTMDQARSVTATFAAVPPANMAPTAAFTFSCSGRSCAVDGSGSADSDGTIVTYSWGFGDQTSGSGQVAHHTYAGYGTYPVSLTVTDDVGATATVTHTVTLTNAAPTASFTVRCTGLSCSVDGRASADSDGTIVSYAWSFGDGAGGSGATTSHTYAGAGSYIVALTVTDDGGTSATVSRRINPISLFARGYKSGGTQKVDLSWSDGGAAAYDIYRGSGRIATVQGTSYTDLVKKGPGRYVYRVCASQAFCSADVSVVF